RSGPEEALGPDAAHSVTKGDAFVERALVPFAKQIGSRFVRECPPREILREEYLKPLGLGQLEGARRLGVSLNSLNEIRGGARRPEMPQSRNVRKLRRRRITRQFWARRGRRKACRWGALAPIAARA